MVVLLQKYFIKKGKLVIDGCVNMTKWADYVIIAVRFKNEKQHIEQVKIMTDTGDTLTNKKIVSRIEIIRLIESGDKIFTVYKKDDGNWKKGDAVGIVNIRGVKFIRTDGNSIEKDNLGELPEF